MGLYFFRIGNMYLSERKVFNVNLFGLKLFEKEPKNVEVELDKEILRLQENLKTLDVADPDYGITIGRIDDLLKVRQVNIESKARAKKDSVSKVESVVKIVTSVGTLCLAGLGLLLSFNSDNSEHIVNRAVLSVTNKIWKT